MEEAIYSFVIPVFNEEETLPELFKELIELLDRLDGEAEVILIDDGSLDRSAALMLEMHHHDPRFKVIRFSRNFGHQIAVTAGLDYARGQALIVMDADLQDPPQVVPEMIKKWREGYEIVYGRRDSREGEGIFKKATAALFYRIMGAFVDFEIPADSGDFRLVDRKAAAVFRSLREKNRFVRGLFSWVGFKQCEVRYARRRRFAGKTHYPFRKMLRLAANAIVGFSDKPLRFALGIGFLFSAISLLYGVAAIILKVGGFYVVQGWSSLAAIICFLGGVQLMVLGIIGEYIGRIYEETKRRPLYVVDRVYGLVDEGQKNAIL